MSLDVDWVIFGGGCAGLWLHDELRRLGQRSLLLEAAALGGAQTIGSQGILHGGVKYLLKGAFSASARAVKSMPAVWRASLAGTAGPDLSAVRLRSACCYLWRSDSWQSWAGMLGARAMLEVKPVPLPDAERPSLLARCPGQVFRLDEEVMDTASFCRTIAARHAHSILQIDPNSVQFHLSADGNVERIELATHDGQRSLNVNVQQVVLSAGAGNEALREKLKLPGGAMQRRPLHMALLRGDLPVLNGHCVDGSKTRVTITSDTDSAGRVAWQVGGQVAEDGVAWEPAVLWRHVKKELTEVLPGWQPANVEWATYRIDRAEARTADGARPQDVQLLHERNVFTAWPTKLVLAPRMTQCVLEAAHLTARPEPAEFAAALAELQWPAPPVALPPWERVTTWSQHN